MMSTILTSVLNFCFASVPTCEYTSLGRKQGGVVFQSPNMSCSVSAQTLGTQLSGCYPDNQAQLDIGSPSFEKYDQPDMTPSGFCSSASSTVRSASTARTDCVSEKATMLRAKKRMDDSSAVLESVSNWTYAAIGSEPACFFIREDRSARRCARSWPAFAAAKTTMLSTCIGKHNFSASHSRPTRRELFAVVPPWEPVPLSAEEARTFGNPQHLSSYAMLRLDVGRHPCASTWVRMVIIAPRELGQERGELGLLFLAKQSKPLISKRTTRR